MYIGIWIEWLSININHLSAFISPFTNPLLKVQRTKNSYAFSWSWKSSCNLHDFLEYLKWVKGVKSPLGTSFLSLFLFSCLLILLYFFSAAMSTRVLLIDFDKCLRVRIAYSQWTVSQVKWRELLLWNFKNTRRQVLQWHLCQVWNFWEAENQIYPLSVKYC